MSPYVRNHRIKLDEFMEWQPTPRRTFLPACFSFFLGGGVGCEGCGGESVLLKFILYMIYFPLVLLQRSAFASAWVYLNFYHGSRAFYDKRISQEVSGDALGEVSFKCLLMCLRISQWAFYLCKNLFVTGVQGLCFQNHGRLWQARISHEAGCIDTWSCSSLASQGWVCGEAFQLFSDLCIFFGHVYRK